MQWIHVERMREETYENIALNACDPSTWEAEARGSVTGLAWATGDERVRVRIGVLVRDHL